MAVDMLEDNELSALAKNRTGGFKNERTAYEKFGKVPHGTFVKSNADKDFSNFSIGNFSFLEPNAKFLDTESKAKHAATKYNGVANDKSFSYNDSMTCDQLQAVSDAMQVKLDEIQRAQSAGKAKFNGIYAGDYSALKTKQDDLNNLISSKACLQIQQAQQQAQVEQQNLQLISATTLAAQKGLDATKTVPTSITKYLLYGGIGVGILVLGIFAYKHIVK